VKLVGAVLEDLVDDSAGVAGELGVHGAGDDVLFLQSVGIDLNAFALERAVVDVGTVEEVIVLGVWLPLLEKLPKRSEDSTTPGSSFCSPAGSRPSSGIPSNLVCGGYLL
jgi:hypothetical protein